MPMDCNYNFHKTFNMFSVKMRPHWRVDNKVAKLSNETAKEYQTSPFDQVGGFSLFERWYSDTLGLKENKYIIPLVWDWSEVSPYLKLWMGEESFKYHISQNHRELKSVLNFFNDRHDFWGEEVDFKFATRSQLFRRLNVPLIERNSTVAQCRAFIDAYQFMLRRYIPGFKPEA